MASQLWLRGRAWKENFTHSIDLTWKMTTFFLFKLTTVLRVFHRIVSNSCLCPVLNYVAPQSVHPPDMMSHPSYATPFLYGYYLWSKTKASSFSGMFPRYSRLCLMMALAARHCRVVWFMGWMTFLDSSFSSRRSQAVCWKALVLSKWVPDEISRFMMSGWPLDAATWSGLCVEITIK